MVNDFKACAYRTGPQIFCFYSPISDGTAAKASVGPSHRSIRSAEDGHEVGEKPDSDQ